MDSQKLLPPLAALRAFDAVGRLGGIRRAARELAIDHAVVSRHVRALETWVGVDLVRRNAGGRELTPAGLEYHANINRALSAIMSATGALMDSDVETKLCLWCSPGIAELWLADRLHAFLAANPDIDAEFRPSDRMADFREHAIDGDIRYVRDWERHTIPKLVTCRDLFRPQVIPVASPHYVATIGPITDPSEFLGLNLLHYGDDRDWYHWLLSQNCIPPERLPGPRLWHASVAMQAARQGQGIVLVNRFLLGQDLASGRLVEIHPLGAPFNPVTHASYSFLARADRWNAPPLLRFRTWLRQLISHNADAILAASIPDKPRHAIL